MEAAKTLAKFKSSEEGFDCKYLVKIVFTITASIVEHTKLITRRQYVEISYEPGNLIKKTDYRAYAITKQK